MIVETQVAFVAGFLLDFIKIKDQIDKMKNYVTADFQKKK